MSALTTTKQSAVATKAGWVITALVTLFFAFDAITHIAKVQAVKDSFADLELPLSMSVPIGVILAVSLILYVTPKTDLLGAILLTSYLGGALATQMRLDETAFGTMIFPVIFGVFVWAGLWLRDPAVREVMPVRRDR